MERPGTHLRGSPRRPAPRSVATDFDAWATHDVDGRLVPNATQVAIYRRVAGLHAELANLAGTADRGDSVADGLARIEQGPAPAGIDPALFERGVRAGLGQQISSSPS